MRRLALALAVSLFATASAFAQTTTTTTTTTPLSPPGARPAVVQPPVAAPVKRTGFQMYSSEATAKSACGSDTVVWGNSASHVYHLPGAPYYGKTKAGGYMCQSLAGSGGYRVSKNGS